MRRLSRYDDDDDDGDDDDDDDDGHDDPDDDADETVHGCQVAERTEGGWPARPPGPPAALGGPGAI